MQLFFLFTFFFLRHFYGFSLSVLVLDRSFIIHDNLQQWYSRLVSISKAYKLSNNNEVNDKADLYLASNELCCILSKLSEM